MVLKEEQFVLQGELLEPSCLTCSGEGWMNKRIASPTVPIMAFAVMIIIGFGFAGSLHLGVAQNSTLVNGIIHSDTTWTKANSPYTLTSPVAVNIGVTLTIEPGVTVNLNSYYIQVNGTLIAKGNTDQIYFNNGNENYAVITLNSANSYNEQTGLGSIIENAVFTRSISINSGSPKIDNNFIPGIDISGGLPVISGNTIIGGVYVHDGSPTILSNTVAGVISIQGGSATISYNTVTGENSPTNYGITLQTASSVISNNNISKGIYVVSSSSSEISSNTITGGISLNGASTEISNNTITGGSDGISILQDSVVDNNANIHDNFISGCSRAGIYGSGGSNIGVFGPTHDSVTIQRNLITNNEYGIQLSGDMATIQYNTIANNAVGIYGPSSSSYSVIYNNIQSNDQNIHAGRNDYDALNNWWGTADTQAINRTIYDFKNDFNLGTVDFIPFLTEPNPQAPAIPTSNPTITPTPTNTPTPNQSTTPTPSPNVPATSSLNPQPTSTLPNQNPTSSPNQTNPQMWLYQTVIVVLAIVIVALLIAMALMHRRTRISSNAH